MTGWIKIVPDSAPNADGEWIEIAAEIPRVKGINWLGIVAVLKPHVPEGFHIVAISKDGPPNLKGALPRAPGAWGKLSEKSA